MILTVNNIFYNIVSILIGLLLILFATLNIKKHNLALTISTYIHSILFILFGILGFFWDGVYETITVLAMLAFATTYILSLLLTKKPNDNKTKPAK